MSDPHLFAKISYPPATTMNHMNHMKEAIEGHLLSHGVRAASLPIVMYKMDDLHLGRASGGSGKCLQHR